jgi:hypothetical protein
VLSEFRSRLVEGGAELLLLDTLLEHLQQQGLVKARGRQRTDSTHVLAALRGLNRLEGVGECLLVVSYQPWEVLTDARLLMPRLCGQAVSVRS